MSTAMELCDRPHLKFRGGSNAYWSGKTDLGATQRGRYAGNNVEWEAYRNRLALAYSGINGGRLMDEGSQELIGCSPHDAASAGGISTPMPPLGQNRDGETNAAVGARTPTTCQG